MPRLCPADIFPVRHFVGVRKFIPVLNNEFFFGAKGPKKLVSVEFVPLGTCPQSGSS